MAKIHKPAGFWIRFLARALDYVAFAAFSVGIAFLLMKHVSYDDTIYKADGVTVDTVYHTSTYVFLENWKYYVWLLSNIAMVLVLFIAIPLITNGRTIFMALFRIKIVFTKNKLWSLIKRELFLSLTIALNLVLILALFDATIFSKFARSDIKDYKDFLSKHGRSYFSATDNLRISIVTTLASLTFVGQLIMGISIIMRKQRLGLHDSYSNTKTIWEKRYVELKDKKTEDGVKSFAPHLVKKQSYEWTE